MTVLVSLRDLVAELALASRKRSMGLDLATRTFVSLDERRGAAVAPESAESPDGPAARIERGELLPLPSEKHIRLAETARSFAESQDDPERRESLLWALRGRGGLHCFQDTLRRLEHESAWELERDRYLAEVAIRWLDLHQLDYTRDLAPWGQFRRLS